MAVRLVWRFRSQQILSRVCFPSIFAQKHTVGTPSKNEDVISTNEFNNDSSPVSDGSKDYFRSLFYETHPALAEKNSEKPTPHAKEPANPTECQTPVTSSQLSSCNERTEESASLADVFSSNVNLDPYPKDFVSSKLDPDILDSIGPPLPKSFNLANFADKSETLQHFIKLGVNLFTVERLGHGQYYLNLDFDRDVKNHLLFLNDFGIDAEKMGTFITRNPLIFKERLEDLQVRIKYLESKKFGKDAISRIIYIAPAWLSHDTKAIDSKLGTLQKLFSLSGDDLRFLVTKKPKIALSNFQRLRENNFLIQEEMGFTKEESKKLLFETPKLWMLNRQNLWERFDYIHNVMKIPHNLILAQPSALLKRKFKIRERHLFLEKLGRVQYDPTKEGYVSLVAIAFAEEDVFCADICKTTVEDFNKFLKTL